MAFRHKSGRTKLMRLLKRATLTAAISKGDLLAQSDTGAAGLHAFADNGGDTAATSPLPIFGVAAQDVATTNVTASLISVEVPLENYVEWEFDVDSDGGLVASDVGGLRDADTLGRNLDRSKAIRKDIKVTRLVSTSLGIGILQNTPNTASVRVGTIST